MDSTKVEGNLSAEAFLDFVKRADKRLDDLEASRPKAQALTLYSANWTDGSGDENYPYQYVLTVDGVTEASRADAYFDKASVDAAAASGVSAETNTAEDAVIFTSRTAPTVNLTGVLYVTKTVAVSGGEGGM